jgi:hypothetical protein
VGRRTNRRNRGGHELHRLLSSNGVPGNPAAGAAPGNRLALETSPYLLQHQDNPVHWQPWGPAAFEEAARRDCPVLLSVGYSSCHWCHVMAHESFEDAAVARVMNEAFVPVKVDREERPDVDEIYMAFVQATTGAGGWPLTVFVAPDRTPFFGGTYFPPEDRWGRPGFPRILEAIAAVWKDASRRAELLQGGMRLLDRLRQAAELPGRLSSRGTLITSDPVGRAVREFLGSYDREHGGFGSAPKFPPSRQLSLLLRNHLQEGDAQSLDASLFTLRRMADGGLFDQLGGGFHRYSTDAEWLAPHFEKMLYDNALLAPVYLLAHRITGDPRLAGDARRVLAWMKGEMRNPEGAFYAALDADSEGEEGRYYTWTSSEIDEILGEDAALFGAAHDVRPGGNWEGRTILRRTMSDAALGERFALPAGEIGPAIDKARQRLLAVRARRVRPGLDDKVLLSWNALAVTAFARAHRALGDEDHLSTAQAAGRFLLDNLRSGGRYFAVWSRGQAKVSAMLEDHAFWLQALLDLFESDLDESWLTAAEEVADILDGHFAAPGGGFYTTADDHEALPVRTRSGYDGALPSGNAVAADALLRLANLTGSKHRRDTARGIITAFFAQAVESPAGFATLLTAVQRYLAEPRQVVVVGRGDAAATREALHRLRGVPAEDAVVLLADVRAAGKSNLPAVRAAREAGSGDGGLAFLPCRGGVCSLPLASLEAACGYLRS